LPHAIAGFDPPLGLKHRHVQSLLAGWPWRYRWVRRRAAKLLANASDEVLDCGAGVRLLGHHSPQPHATRGLVILLHGWEVPPRAMSYPRQRQLTTPATTCSD